MAETKGKKAGEASAQGATSDPSAQAQGASEQPTPEQARIAELEGALRLASDHIAARELADAQAAQAQTEAAAQVAERRPDETVPGGRYLVNGMFVDCNGKPLKDQGEE